MRNDKGKQDIGNLMIKDKWSDQAIEIAVESQETWPLFSINILLIIIAGFCTLPVYEQMIHHKHIKKQTGLNGSKTRGKALNRRVNFPGNPSKNISNIDKSNGSGHFGHFRVYKDKRERGVRELRYQNRISLAEAMRTSCTKC